MDGYEVTAEPTEGRNLTTGLRIIGYRIRYRREGDRFYRRFILTLDPAIDLTDEMLERAIREHEQASASR